MRELTIVMYHYVRDLPRTRWPGIKGLLTADFDGQLDYIARRHKVVGEADVRAALAGQAELPPDACWLTFDDGFVDHYETVWPRLADRGWAGSFYPAAGPLRDGRLLDVHRIHFILASAKRPEQVCEALLETLSADAPADGPSIEQLRAEHFVANRFDPPAVNFVKRVLQLGLPETRRSELCGRLFARFVTADEADFAAQFYMNFDQMRQMADAGMSFGVHGRRHRWLASLPAGEQADEIDASLELLGEIVGRPAGESPADWSISYPYGSYNATTLELAAGRGAAIGLTTRVGLAGPGDRPLELPRLDTNDLPKRP